MNMAFGTVPYKRTWYTDVAENSSAEMQSLINVLVQLRNGRFDQVELLIPFLSHPNFDVRQYAHQLFADVCTNQQVKFFEEALKASKTLDEARRIILRLGETFSLSAIPILLDWRNELDGAEVDEYVCHALRTLFPLREVNQYSIAELDVFDLYEKALTGLDRSDYYYRGKPLFVGDVTKELIVACTAAYREKKYAALLMQPQILSNFTGMQCPVMNGKPVVESDMKKVFGYVSKIAETPWKEGHKYFFGNEI